MKTTTVSTIIAGLTAGAITLWHTGPVKKLRERSIEKVRPAKEEKKPKTDDHLFI